MDKIHHLKIALRKNIHSQRHIDSGVKWHTDTVYKFLGQILVQQFNIAALKATLSILRSSAENLLNTK